MKTVFHKAATRRIDSLLQRYPALQPIRQSLWESCQMLFACYADGHKVLVAGNGGSAADAEHIVGELMKGFDRDRKLETSFVQKLVSTDPVRGKELAQTLQKALPILSLMGHPAFQSAYLNDLDGRMALAQQVLGYGNSGDVFWGISTSGNAQNILYAAVTAKAKGMPVLALTGKAGGDLAGLADISIQVPDEYTPFVQELHLPIYHCICHILEDAFFDN